MITAVDTTTRFVGIGRCLNETGEETGFGQPTLIRGSIRRR